MKITFKYSTAFVSGECTLEVEDGKEMLSVDVGEAVEEDDLNNMSAQPNARYLFHTSSVDVSYPVIDSCAKAFYGNISGADVRIINEMNRKENEIDITTFSDQEKKTL